MAEFTAIETQEQLDAIIKARLDREKASHQTELQTLNDRIKALEKDAEGFSGYAKEKSELEAKISRYETDSAKREIAEEYGLPKGFHSRLQGENAEQWRSDAETLQKLVGNDRTPPLASHDPQIGKDEKLANAYKKMTSFMEG